MRYLLMPLRNQDTVPWLLLGLNCRPLGRHMKTLMINSAFRRCFLASPLRWLPLPLALRRRLDLPLDLLLPPCLTWAAEQLPADVKLLRDTDRGSSSCELILPILTGWHFSISFAEC